MPLQIRRGLEAERLQLTSVNGLVEGELLYVTDDKKIYIGTGVSGEHRGIPVTGYTNEDAIDAVGAALVNGTHEGGLSFTYGIVQDGLNRIDTSLDLSSYNNGLSVGKILSNLEPVGDDLFNLGTPTEGFKNLYLASGSIYMGSAVIESSGSIINLPAGSTIGGQPIDNPEGNIKASIYGEDSSIIVNHLTGTVTGNFVGNIVGSVVGENSVTLVDATSGEIVAPINTTQAFFDSRDLGLDSTITVVHDGADIGLLLESIATINTGAKLSLSSYRGTRESKSVLSANDVLGQVLFSGYTDSPIGALDLAMAGFRGVHTLPGNISTIPESKLELLCFRGPNPADAKIATFDTTGTFSAPIIRPGVYADATARDTAITTPLAGMMVFNTALQKFQGYVSDTGLAGGGSSNGTPGWIDIN